MDSKHIAALLNYAATVDSRIRRTMANDQQAAVTIQTWATALADVPATADETGWNAAHAMRRYYEQHGGDRSAQFHAIEPHHLLAAWAIHRGELMDRHTDPLPAADPDDTTAYRAEIIGTRAAVATGQAPPGNCRAAIDSAGQEQLAAKLAGVGREPRPYMPAHIAEQLGQSGLGARRQRLPELSVECPHETCRAREGNRCKSPSGRELRSHTHDKRQRRYAESIAQQQRAAA
ncbi:zinc finger domain-containing protein [Streptomyces nigrescens]|uniref:zinc finger domain-containing protein n=1 Tax=Streptomyces nigrescens TaxID=1920 RepID=UPI0022549611|nr:hypothetical protein [Streptomyces libani]MCX5445982.1 hypothetical protein [Streptomyces libani]